MGGMLLSTDAYADADANDGTDAATEERVDCALLHLHLYIPTVIQ